MPQDIPLERSDTLPFTPQSLIDNDNPPVFALRACTTREKFFHQRLLDERGIVFHSDEDLRREMLIGVRELCDEDDADRLIAALQDYWTAIDDYAAQSRDNPDLVWEYDPAIESTLKRLDVEMGQQWPPLAKMRADIRQLNVVTELAYVAVTVKSFSGIDVKRRTDRSYLTIDCAYDLRNALDRLDRNAWRELALACLARMYLDEETAKNFVSPSPSETTLPPSSETDTSEQAGKSKASASSGKTPVAA